MPFTFIFIRKWEKRKPKTPPACLPALKVATPGSYKAKDKDKVKKNKARKAKVVGRPKKKKSGTGTARKDNYR